MKLVAALALLLCAVPAAAQRLVEKVDPFIGTDGTGHTFPGPSLPFGMVQPGPDNAETGWEYTSGYQLRAPKIIGFSQTRASGSGIPELGDVLLMPSAARRADLASSKANEVARPGYYAVTLPDNGVRVELTSGLRTAFHRYVFARGGRVWVLVDLQHGLTFRADRQPVLASDTRVTRDGVEGVQRRSNWTTRTIAFSLAFDRPIAATIDLPPRPGDAAKRYLLGFDLAQGQALQAKVGLSTVDVAGARRNRESLAGWNFAATRVAAAAAWESLLARATITAPPAQQRIFYTALYHAFLHPSVISDVDGRWRGPDGQVRTAARGLRYSTLSLWDTFRAAHPLYTLLVPERVNDFVQTLLDHAEATGRLPMWTIWGGETGTMIGEPAMPVIADAWAKGFRGFDGRRALAAMVRTGLEDNRVRAADDVALSSWAQYARYGYFPFDLAGGESVSRTLEAGIHDDATARMAAMLGDREVAARFAQRAEAWRALMDPETRLARGRDGKGGWRTPFDPLTPTSPLNNPGDYTEANAWQYSWTPALFDPPGLNAAMGGPRDFRAMLDRFFFDLPPTKGAEYLGQEAMIGQYAHGNEPSHHIAWLYALTDRPWTGQQLVRRIATEFYRDDPRGIIGNDDCGQMSAWYVFATLGFYPLEPASGRYVLGAPLVSRARLRLAGGRRLEIMGGGGAYAPDAVLNGRRLGGAVSHAALARGGTLRFLAAPVPANTGVGAAP
ncbi:MAG: hypothetical protein A4S12_09025 [Proteobacteria bacterium SG_bin5]|nr:MAG: hypothetical protein A4S12_09025 [Proteobacteria bacterium SG_bin5]